MLGVFLLIFIFVLGINILTAYSGSSVASGPTLPPFVKQENFLDPKDQRADYRLLADVLPTLDPMRRELIIICGHSLTVALLPGMSFC